MVRQHLMLGASGRAETLTSWDLEQREKNGIEQRPEVLCKDPATESKDLQLVLPREGATAIQQWNSTN